MTKISKKNKMGHVERVYVTKIRYETLKRSSCDDHSQTLHRLSAVSFILSAKHKITHKRNVLHCRQLQTGARLRDGT